MFLLLFEEMLHHCILVDEVVDYKAQNADGLDKQESLVDLFDVGVGEPRVGVVKHFEEHVNGCAYAAN